MLLEAMSLQIVSLALRYSEETHRLEGTMAATVSFVIYQSSTFKIDKIYANEIQVQPSQLEALEGLPLTLNQT